MATLLDLYAPFDSGPGANTMESTWREMMKHMLGSASGVIRGFDGDFATTGDSSGMQVKVATGQCWMRGHFGQSTAIKTLPIAAAHATNPRKDIVVLRADFVDNNIEVDVITGTAAGSPVAPSVTQNASLWETLLAVVDVPATAVTITSGNVVDWRVYTTGFAKYTRSTTQSITHNTFVNNTYDSVTTRAGDIVANAAMTEFTLGRAGLWTITAQNGYTAHATGGRALEIQDTSGTIYAEDAKPTSSASVNTYLTCTASERFALGTTIRTQTWQNSGAGLNTLANTVKLSLMWVGP